MFDFYSDTKTKPTRAMREAALAAEVGDEQKGEDPTTNALCERVAGLLGKEAAVFLPSGTMCNAIAIRVHVRPGEEIICERKSHIVTSEAGGPAALSGAMMKPLDGMRGMLSPEQVAGAISPGTRHAPRSRLLSVEQTANMSGGAVWPVEQLQAVATVAKAAGLATHMDGARLMNAVVRTGVPATEHCAGYDSCWLDFSKGLGAPVGAVLAGSAAFIDEALRYKQQLGGSMRQSGVLAAMCLHALDHHVERLAEDHALAQGIAEHLQGFRKVSALLPVETNIVIFDIAENGSEAAELVRLCAGDGITIGAFGKRRIRIVTHHDVDGAAAASLCASLSAHLG